MRINSQLNQVCQVISFEASNLDRLLPLNNVVGLYVNSISKDALNMDMYQLTVIEWTEEYHILRGSK